MQRPENAFAEGVPERGRWRYVLSEEGSAAMIVVEYHCAMRPRSGGIAGFLVSIPILLPCVLAIPAAAQSLDVSQYLHTAWKTEAWVSGAEIETMGQTPDGYLWGTTREGLYRFDGVRFTAWKPPNGQKLPHEHVLHLSVLKDGTLWFSTENGVASWRDEKLTSYKTGAIVTSNVLERADGTIWFGLWNRTLCTIRAQAFSCLAGEALDGRPKYLAEDRDGSLWVVTNLSIWRRGSAAARRYTLPGGVKPRAAVADGDGGLLIVGDDDRLWLMRGDTITEYPGIDLRQLFPLSPDGPGEILVTGVLRSRDGAVWLATQQGIVHVHGGRTDRFTVADGLSGSVVLGFFEDRDGNIWVSTWDGLDRFQPVAVRTISSRQGLASPTVRAVQASPTGDVWISTAAGLNRIAAGTTTVTDTELRGPIYALGLDAQGQLLASTTAGLVRERGGRFARLTATPAGPVVAIATDADGRIWLSTARGELFRREPGGTFVAVPIRAPKATGKRANLLNDLALHGQDRVRLILPDRTGGLWLTFGGWGAAHLLAAPSTAAYVGLDDDPIIISPTDIRLGSDGWNWAATRSDVTRFTDGRVMSLTTDNGLPGTYSEWTIEDDTGAMWIHHWNSLVRFDRAEWEAWSNEPKRVMKIATLLTSNDGVRPVVLGHALSPSVTKSADGRIWFAAANGVGMFDPRHVSVNLPPLQPQVEQFSADGRIEQRPWSRRERIRLGPSLRNLAIEFTAPTFTAPEKVRFRFKLDGQDPDWRESVNQRQVAYSNLAPGPYRFQVMAANAGGVWSRETAVLEFDVAPAFYQRRSFAAATVALAFVLVGLAHRLRMRQVSRALSRRFDERLAERTRVAREIHDTFLQTVQGSKMVADHALKHGHDHDGMARAMRQLSDWLKQASDEARAALNSLRTSTTDTNDLANAFRRAVDECRAGTNADISFSVRGEAREMHPVVRDEVFRIGHEAIRNACVHSGGDRISISLEYGQDVSLRVCDNGVGIDPAIVERGKEGHFGMGGMKERAERINARFHVVAAETVGTTIELFVPGAVAFVSSAKIRLR